MSYQSVDRYFRGPDGVVHSRHDVASHWKRIHADCTIDLARGDNSSFGWRDDGLGASDVTCLACLASRRTS